MSQSADVEQLLSQIEKILGKEVKSSRHFEIALTHRSFVNEASIPGLEDNERYEFLGDAVLQLAVSDLLMRRHPDETEGVLSKYRSAVVNEKALADAARSMQLGSFLRLGKGEELTQGRKKQSILANGFEAVIAGIYQTGGFQDALRFVESCLGEHLSEIEDRSEKHDYKTVLQEMTQQNMKEAPTYRLVQEDGPDHEKIFETEVLLKGKVFGKGRARSKKESEQIAAQVALELLQSDSGGDKK